MIVQPTFNPDLISDWYSLKPSIFSTYIDGVKFDYRDVANELRNPATSYFYSQPHITYYYRNDEHWYVTESNNANASMEILNRPGNYDYVLALSGYRDGGTGSSVHQSILMEVYIYPHLYAKFPNLDFYLILGAGAGDGFLGSIKSWDTSNLRETILHSNSSVAYTTKQLSSWSNPDNMAYYLSNHGISTSYYRYFPTYSFTPEGLNDDDFDYKEIVGVYKVNRYNNAYGYDVSKVNAPSFRYSVLIEDENYLAADDDEFYISAGIYGYPSLEPVEIPENGEVGDVFSLIRSGFDSASSFFSYEVFSGVTIGGLLSIPVILSLLLAVFKLLRK